MRQHLTFDCEGERLAATVDHAAGSAALLWVSGGNEIRSGAFGGQSHLAAKIAAAGHPVMRFDRRGIGDSAGENYGFRDSAADIAAALATLRAVQPHVTRVTAFGNCDAASALMLQNGHGLQGLVLSNPWTFSNDNAPPPPAAIRSRYAAKLASPGEWIRLASGQVSLGKLARGLWRAASPVAPPSTLATEIADGLRQFRGSVRILIAERDRTGQAFLDGWPKGDPRVCICPGASHAFAEPDARAWLYLQLLKALAQEQAG